MKKYNDFKSFSKDQAYWERNQLVAALSKIYPSCLSKHPLSDKSWDKEWRNIVYITIPVECNPRGFAPECYMEYGVQQLQLSWHLHDDDVVYFKHLPRVKTQWDGHSTIEKYERLRFLHVETPKKWYQFWK